MALDASMGNSPGLHPMLHQCCRAFLSSVLAPKLFRLSGMCLILVASGRFLQPCTAHADDKPPADRAATVAADPPSDPDDVKDENKAADAADANRAEHARIDPAGISGSLLLSGEQVSDEALERFLDAAGRDKARLVVVRTGNGEAAQSVTSRLLQLWERRSGRGLQVVRATLPPKPAGNESETPPETPALEADDLAALQRATAVWLAVDDDGSAERLLANPALCTTLQQVVERGAVVGGAGAIACHLATELLSDGGPEQDSRSGLGLLPDAVVNVLSAESANSSDSAGNSSDSAGEPEPSNDEGASRLTSWLAARPALVGYELAPTAALFLNGRFLQAIGDGQVRIHLAESAGRPARSWTLEPPRPYADLTSLRRAARIRAAANFPPTKPEPPVVENGTLIIIGGGGMPQGIVERFVQLAGGEKASILVLPTANPDPLPQRDGIAELFRKAGAAKVTVLPGRTLGQVESDEYLSAFREATGVWFGGGRQWRFVDAYQGTKAQELMQDMVRRGGVVMGSSAGASIQAEYLARGNPLGNLDIMAEGYEQGLGFLKGVAVDQHFAQRKRFSDMASLVQRYPQILGIGIDEATALVVQGGQGEIVGRGAVHFFDAARPVVDGEPGYETVPAGGRYDLVTRKVVPADGD